MRRRFWVYLIAAYIVIEVLAAVFIAPRLIPTLEQILETPQPIYTIPTWTPPPDIPEPPCSKFVHPEDSMCKR